MEHLGHRVMKTGAVGRRSEVDGRMRFRKLRIAWSVGCGIVCVLLVVLWVRSYTWREYLVGNFSPYVPLLNFSSDAGQLKYSDIRRNDIHPVDFAIISRRAEESLKIRSVFDSNLVAGFGIRLAPNSWSVAAPHWFIVALSATFAALPWLRWRFSLRALLIATTLVAVVLGLIIFLNNKQNPPPLDVGDFPVHRN